MSARVEEGAGILRPDICVIGAGSGGLSVAAIAAAFGVPVILIEKGEMGGDCLNYGCVPSKALLAAARRAQAVREAPSFGIDAAEPQIAFRRVLERVRQVVADIAPIDSQARFEALGVRVLRAEARFSDRRTVIAGEHVIRARRFVIATGARPAVPPIPGLDRVPFHTNETIFSLPRRPNRLLIIGAGPVGLEMAQAFARLGSAVTVLDQGPPLAHEDPELARLLVDEIQREGVTIRSGVAIAAVEPRRGGVRLRLEVGSGRETIEGNALLVATGRVPALDGLGLEAAGIRREGRGLKVDARLRTSNRRVYAVGDAVGGPQFTHVANHHAGIVVRAILFRLRPKVGYDHVPRVTYTEPELAQVGLTEAQARKRHRRIRILRVPFGDNDRARAEGERAGHVKLIAGARGEILGVGILGPQAGELIQLWTLAIRQRLRLSAIVDMVVPYPTLGEAGKRAAVEFYRDGLTNPWLRRIIRFLRAFG